MKQTENSLYRNFSFKKSNTQIQSANRLNFGGKSYSVKFYEVFNESFSKEKTP